MGLSEGFVEANGIRLHYLRWGAGGPPAVLLHATGFLARLWEPVAEELARRYHVYAFDARGHGDSDKPAPSGAEGPTGGYGWAVLAGDLMGFLDALNLRAVRVVGHSSGAAGAIRLAATRPEYVAAAVLIEPTVFPPMPARGDDQRRDQLSEGAAKRRMVWPSREELLAAYRERPTFSRWREDVLRLYVEHGTFRREDGQYQLKCPGEIEAELYRNSLSPDTWDLLPDVRCPALVLRGENTEPLLARVAEGVAGRIPGARLLSVAGTSHFLPMERPDVIARVALAFLDGGEPAGE